MNETNYDEWKKDTPESENSDYEKGQGIEFLESKLDDLKKRVIKLENRVIRLRSEVEELLEINSESFRESNSYR